MGELFPTTLRVEVEGYDNRVVVGGPGPLRARALRAAVGAHPVLSKTLPKLSFKTLHMKLRRT
jgi:hydroxyacyl-ACP dehydratase HTD2-like protein with hotdog domain